MPTSDGSTSTRKVVMREAYDRSGPHARLRHGNAHGLRSVALEALHVTEAELSRTSSPRVGEHLIEMSEDLRPRVGMSPGRFFASESTVSQPQDGPGISRCQFDPDDCLRTLGSAFSGHPRLFDAPTPVQRQEATVVWMADTFVDDVEPVRFAFRWSHANRT